MVTMHGKGRMLKHHTQDAKTAFAHEEGGIVEQHIMLVVEHNAWVRRVTPRLNSLHIFGA